MRPAAALLAVPLLMLLPAPAGAEPVGNAPAACAGTPATITVGASDPQVALGTEGDDVVRVTGAHSVVTYGGDDTVCVGRGATLAGAELGAGDDDLVLVDARDGDRRTDVDGGTGTDRVAAMYDRTVDLDLGAGKLRGTYRGGEGAFTLHGFEDASVTAGTARAVGDAGPNLISVYACRTIVAGGPGADTLIARPMAVLDFKPTPSCHGRFRLTARGGPGADTIHGRRHSETLIGGPGRDTIDGGGGHDACDAEKKRNCS